jgi:hypothetical protein
MLLITAFAKADALEGLFPCYLRERISLVFQALGHVTEPEYEYASYFRNCILNGIHDGIE